MLSMSRVRVSHKGSPKRWGRSTLQGLQAVSLCCLHLHTFGAGSFKQSNCNAHAHFAGAHHRPQPPSPPAFPLSNPTTTSYNCRLVSNVFFLSSPSIFYPETSSIPDNRLPDDSCSATPPRIRRHGSLRGSALAFPRVLFQRSSRPRIPQSCATACPEGREP